MNPFPPTSDSWDLLSISSSAISSSSVLPSENFLTSSELLFPSYLSLRQRLPLSEAQTLRLTSWRKILADSITGRSHWFVVICGPCSVDSILYGDERSLSWGAIGAYAEKLVEVAKQLAEHGILVVLRTFLEKPRTGPGWRGWLGDLTPDNLVERLYLARAFLLHLHSLGLPVAMELVDPLLAPYFEDLITWGGIGARTTTSPQHRLMASGVSCPIGFKNPLDGDVLSAIQGVLLAREGHSYPALNGEGQLVLHSTPGNKYGHLVLRGGRSGPNFGLEAVTNAKRLLEEHHLPSRLIVDCSHGNAEPKPQGQVAAWRSVLKQRENSECPIAGAILESYLLEGNYKGEGVAPYGMSITDPCLGWEQTRKLLLELI